MSLVQGNTRIVNNTDVKEVLQGEFGNECKIYTSTREYRFLDKKYVELFIKNDPTDKLKYHAPNNYHDFSRVLIGRALENCLKDGINVGIAFGEVRGCISIDGKQKPKIGSYVVFIVTHNPKSQKGKTQRVYLVDPKTDLYFLPNQKSTYETVFI